MLTVIPIYAALLAALYIYLSFRVINARRASKVALGIGNNPKLQRVIRVHANFAEYVPIALILLVLLDLQAAQPWVLHVLAVMLIIGRALHAYGVSQEVEDFRFRQAGMVMTFACMGFAGFLLLFL